VLDVAVGHPVLAGARDEADDDFVIGRDAGRDVRRAGQPLQDDLGVTGGVEVAVQQQWRLGQGAVGAGPDGGRQDGEAGGDDLLGQGEELLEAGPEADVVLIWCNVHSAPFRETLLSFRRGVES